MSSTFSELTASALIAGLGAQPESGRHLVARIHGEDLQDTFRALLARAEDERSFEPGEGPPLTLRVCDNGDGCIIVPYLVLEPPPANPRDNRGSQGFASALRDIYSKCARQGERMMLLIFDSSPNETLLTTMSQSVAESALELQHLLSLALKAPQDASQALKRTLAELEHLAPRNLAGRLTPELVGRTSQAIAELGVFEKTEEVARELHRIPWFLNDPELFGYAGLEFQGRLERAIEYRRRLEDWAHDPSTDFDAEIRKEFDSATARKVVDARVGGDIDWSGFTLNDLLAGGPPPPPELDTPEFAAMPVTIAEATELKLLSNGKTVAAQTPDARCTLSFHLVRPLVGDSTIHLVGYNGDEPPFAEFVIEKLTAADDYTLTVQLPQPRPGWSFLQAILTKGKRIVKRPLDSVRIAINIGAVDGVLVYEADGLIELEAQAYSGDESLTFIAERHGQELWAQSVEPPDSEFGDLIALSNSIAAPGVQAQRDEAFADSRETESPEHLALDAWATGELQSGPVQTSMRRRPNGDVIADVGRVSMPVAGSGSMPASRWSLERYVIEHPGTTAFSVGVTGIPEPNSDIESLPLGELEDPFARFLVAREAFFAEIAPLQVPSVLSANLTVSEAAAAYIEAYQALLEAVPDDKASHLGYDKILLTDSFKTDTGELLIAPTSPLAVALHMQLQQKVRGWVIGDPAGNYFPGDVGLVTPQYLVPYLRLHSMPGHWLESGYAPYPWRRYLPFSERDRQERHPSMNRYIARRIERFLDVHRSYADERRTLRLAFINPGPATHIRDSLLQLIKSYLGRRGGEKLKDLPAFDLQLLSDKPNDDDLLGADLDLFMSFSPEEGQPSDAAMEVMKRLSYTKGRASEFLQDPKSFAHITFVEDFFRPGTELIQWPSDAHPSSMYVAGLATDTERLARAEPGATRFLRATWSGGPTSEPVSRIATRITEVSAAAAGVPVKSGIVRAADVLVPDTQIPQLYDRSAWVVHIDRHVGLELFAPQLQGSGAPYILDYTDQETPESGIFDGITATSQVGPYQARIVEVLGSAVQQPVTTDAAERLLRTLNLISGRWGLEMLRTDDNVLRARLATALTAQILEQTEALHSDPSVLTLIVALDELLRVTGAEGLPLKEGWAAKAGVKGGGSDDLLLLTVPLGPGRPKLQGRIIEVKYRSGAGVSAETAAEQLKATHSLLTTLLVNKSEPGRSFQGRRLAKLILGYTSRHVAYGVRSEHPAVTAGVRALSRIAAGDYDLDFEIPRMGKVLCGDYISVEPSLDDPSLTAQATTVAGIDIGRIRIGKPVISAMLQSGHVPGGSWQPTTRSSVTTPQEALEQEAAKPANVGSESIEPSAATAIARASEGGGLTHEASSTEEGKTGESDSAPSEPRHRPVKTAFDLPVNALREIGGRLDDVLTSYNLPLQPVQPADAVCGPNTIRFRVRMARGGTIAQVEARERDIMRELGLAKPVMIGQDAGFVTLDVPRTDPVTVTFADLAPVLAGVNHDLGKLPVIFGVDVAGVPRTEDLAQLPHLLIAGSTGSGKSVLLSALLGSLVALPPSRLEIVLVDVKGLDFAPFSALPHLRRPPIGDAAEALEVLDDLYETEREKRRKVLSEAGAQSILDYYTRLGGSGLTQIVIMIDEFSNLLSGDRATGSRLEDTVQKYAEIMRSFGVYLVIATQRPSADIVTGRIKANLPARIALRLPTHNDSLTILGRKGAEQLLGSGDMLFYRDGLVERLQAPFTTAADVISASHHG